MKDLPLLLPLGPNRVRRRYRGGAGIDAFEGAANPEDGERPEDWLASIVEADNLGMPEIAHEGLSRVILPDGSTPFLRDLIKADPQHYVGVAQKEMVGPTTSFLAKLLDSSMRLHVQAHPTARFARKHLKSRYGKLESYVILGVRPDSPGYLRLGFQRPVTREELGRIIRTQDIGALDSLFDPIPVRVGEVYYVPGGLPHAIGEGLTVLEVMEPSDLVVRCEFEREGIVIHPEARYMGRDLDFCLDVFDYNTWSVDDVYSRLRVEPTVVADDDHHTLRQLIGPAQTDCFDVYSLTVRRPVSLPTEDRLQLLLVHSGSGSVRVPRARMPLARSQRCLVAAAAHTFNLYPGENGPLELFVVNPARQVLMVG